MACQGLLVKMGTVSDLEASPRKRLVKEMPERCLVLIRQADGSLVCVELPDASLAQRDNGDLAGAPGSRTHRVISDSDGTLWIAPIPKPSPVIDRNAGPKVGDGYGLGGPAAAARPDMPPPPPLVPFAGCDRKAMPPSPAKPFAIAPSPIKPSPMKERIDTATGAVASKAWGARQAKMSEFFGGAKAGAKPAAPVPAVPLAPKMQQPRVLGTVADMDF
ncbi:hypothetical protein Rsub_00604 [Raphidocelis subcapitata]|uniref:Uncharacterized protein n=1 Tax=Raphidocelis subcapitata TaxID=307507 RepID=A0A2V0NN53_9CHLO|nr:hypothetical protein Rsub_00604 [Raphidocelis subcapitata]|eukprot:GBF87892.1 hypothetical protein Rsub_00604 [Raphidocelis subcapitata]